VSHINGQLVKVGESNDYIKRFRKTVISTNPIGWVTGFYGISLSHALTEHIALRGDVNYINPIEDDDTKLWELGVGLPLYLRRTYQGAFIEPGFIVRSAQQTEYSGTTDANGNWIESKRHYTEQSGGPQVLFGWQWTWDAGYTLAVAAGAGRNILASQPVGDDYESSSEELFFNGYFRVGYSF
jgi:hypothetical protein